MCSLTVPDARSLKSVSPRQDQAVDKATLPLEALEKNPSLGCGHVSPIFEASIWEPSLLCLHRLLLCV